MAIKFNGNKNRAKISNRIKPLTLANVKGFILVF